METRLNLPTMLRVALALDSTEGSIHIALGLPFRIGVIVALISICNQEYQECQNSQNSRNIGARSTSGLN